MGSSDCWLTPNSTFLKGLVSPPQERRGGQNVAFTSADVLYGYCTGESFAPEDGADMLGFTANTETDSLLLEQSVW